MSHKREQISIFGAIIAGLTFSGIAKLFFIPVIYALWFRDYEQKTKTPPGVAA